MKLKKITSLFLYILMLGILNTYAFQQKDSLNYYTTYYNKAKNTDDLIKTFSFFEKDKEYYLQQKFYHRVLYDLYYLSKIEYKLGSYNDSEKSVIEGLELLDSMPRDSITDRRRKSFYNHLAVLKRELKSYEKSYEYYSNVLNLAKNKWDSALVYNNISIIYIKQNQYKKAKSKLQFAIKSFKKLNDSAYLALSLNNLGLVDFKLNKKNGLSNLKEGLKIREKRKDNTIYESYRNLVEYYIENNDSVTALKYANKGYSIALKLNRLSYKEDALLNLIELGKANYVKEFIKVKKTIDSIRSHTENKFSAAKYDYSKAHNQRKEAELKEERAKSKSILYLFSTIFLFLGSIFLYFFLKARNKKGKLQTRFDTERKISKKLHDEVGNGLFHLMSKQQNKPNPDIELIDDLEDAYLKTRDISKSNAALKLSENFDEDLKDLVTSYKTDTVNIFTRNSSQVSWNTLSKLKKETVYLVLQELMTNMRKHSQASIVTFKFEKRQRKIVIHYIDDGIGCDLKKSNGLQNVENRIENIGGTITFESETNKGFQVKIIV